MTISCRAQGQNHLPERAYRVPESNALRESPRKGRRACLQWSYRKCTPARPIGDCREDNRRGREREYSAMLHTEKYDLSDCCRRRAERAGGILGVRATPDTATSVTHAVDETRPYAVRAPRPQMTDAGPRWRSVTGRATTDGNEGRRYLPVCARQRSSPLSRYLIDTEALAWTLETYRRGCACFRHEERTRCIRDLRSTMQLGLFTRNSSTAVRHPDQSS
jgi:hypothetical protein